MEMVSLTVRSECKKLLSWLAEEYDFTPVRDNVGLVAMTSEQANDWLYCSREAPENIHGWQWIVPGCIYKPAGALEAVLLGECKAKLVNKWQA
jgi:hypothetical protein